MNEVDWADTLVVNLLPCTCAGAHCFAATSHDRCPVSKRPVVAQALRDERKRGQALADAKCQPFYDRAIQAEAQLIEARAKALD